MTRRQQWSAALFGADLRALAAFRIGLGVCVLADVAQRATSLRAHYSDAGVLSRADVLQHFAWLHEFPVSAHLMGGSTGFLAVLFGVHALAALALVVGCRTPFAALVAWWLTSSVQLRNLYIGGGFDALLRMLLLWAVFLPLGARWSVDRRLRVASGASPSSAATPHVSVATTALLLQLVIVYLAAGVAKAENSLWWEGGALQRVLHDEMFATALGAFLSGWTGFCRAATWAVLALELCGPFLLVLSGLLAPARLAVVGALLAMNIGFGLALSVGPFPWIASAALVAFVPGRYWDRAEDLARRVGLAAQVGAACDRIAASCQHILGGGGPRCGWRLAQGFCAVVLAYVVAWNVGVALDPGFEAPRSVRWFGNGLFLQQNWRMFAQPSTVSGWVVIPGRLVDGTEVDLLAAGGPAPGPSAIRPVTWERPRSTVGQSADIRWRLLLRRVVGEPDDRGSPQQYGRYLCREWNRQHAGERQLATFDFVRVVRRLAPPYTERNYERQTVWRHDCFG